MSSSYEVINNNRVENEENEGTQQDVDLLEQLNQFVKKYTKYSESIYDIYRVYCDIHKKGYYSNIRILDGQHEFSLPQYILEGTLTKSNKRRCIVPISIDSDVDLIKLHDVVTCCSNNNSEVFIAIYSSENIIYQSVTSEMP